MDCFAALIAQPSISSFDPRLDLSNRTMVELLATWFEGLGFTVELIPVQTEPAKFNLIACAGSGPGGLVLAGHTDTVPCDVAAWRQDPFRLTERDNKLYGLGAADMKCFFPIVIDTLRDVDLTRLRQPLYMLATCDEESTMSGARALVASGRQLGRSALIGEPTGLKPVNRHKAIIMEKIRLIGRSGHASDPALGINALEGMHEVITGLQQWRTAIQAANHDPAFRVAVPTLNFGSIHGGDNPNRICGDCEMTIDLRLLPGMDLEEVRAGIRRTSMQAVDGTGLTIEFESIIPGIPALHTDSETEIVKIAERLAGEPAGAVAFGTEAPYLNAMGMNTVILGAGDIEQAHQADEYLALERIKPMQGLLGKLIKHICIDTQP
ncbi:MAG: acetylornithine deacetylase [Gammaproteobacteria bacterium]|nr:acetylornithine deacetylase [Gammaproteobacteria bacterium]